MEGHARAICRTIFSTSLKEALLQPMINWLHFALSPAGLSQLSSIVQHSKLIAHHFHYAILHYCKLKL